MVAGMPVIGYPPWNDPLRPSPERVHCTTCPASSRHNPHSPAVHFASHGNQHWPTKTVLPTPRRNGSRMSRRMTIDKDLRTHPTHDSAHRFLGNSTLVCFRDCLVWIQRRLGFSHDRALPAALHYHNHSQASGRAPRGRART